MCILFPFYLYISVQDLTKMDSPGHPNPPHVISLQDATHARGFFSDVLQIGPWRKPRFRYMANRLSFSTYGKFNKQNPGACSSTVPHKFNARNLHFLAIIESRLAHVTRYFVISNTHHFEISVTIIGSLPLRLPMPNVDSTLQWSGLAQVGGLSDPNSGSRCSTVSMQSWNW